MKIVKHGLVGLSLVLVIATDNPAQIPSFEPVFTLDSVVVEASKFPFSPYEMPSSMTILTREQISGFAGMSLSDIVGHTLGVQVYDFSGSGTNTTIDIRGFASAGETSYLRLMIDGMPVNELNNDNVDWNLVNIDQVERIEILRGPTSALYGNIGMSGLVNVVTQKPGKGLGSTISLIGGDQNRKGAKAGLQYGGDRMNVSLSGQSFNMDGWRDHSDWQDSRFQGTLGAVLGKIGRRNIDFAISASYLGYDREDPGAIPLSAPVREASTSIDREESRKWLVSASVEIPIWQNSKLELIGSTRGKNSEQVKTIFFQPKNRDIKTRTNRIEARFQHQLRFASRTANLLFGIESELGDLKNAYYEVQPGSGDRASLATNGETKRTSVSTYAQVGLGLTPDVSVIGGLRFDRIDDRYASLISPSEHDTEFKATSSSLALNWRWMTASNAYLSVSRSFKAPTLEQLYDERPFYIAFDLPPITISNEILKPQHAWNYEIGFRTHHHKRVASELALYYLHVKNEIGFDLSNFRYANIDESVHWGIEAGIKFRLHDRLDLRQDYTMMNATFSGGEYDGNQINGVPRHIVLTSLNYHGIRNLSASVELQHVRDQFIDEGNMFPLNDYTVFNTRIGYRLGLLRFDIAIYNLFDKKYYIAGYLTQTQDEMGNLLPLPLFFPARQRTAIANISIRL